MTDDIKLPSPAGYFYEWNSFGLRRSFDYRERNGAIPTRTVQFFTADQLRAAPIGAKKGKPLWQSGSKEHHRGLGG